MFGGNSFILLILQLRVISSNNLGECSTFDLKQECLNKRLIGHSFFTTRTNLHDCIRYCMYLTVCKSVDYDMPAQLCELNDVDSLSVQESEFETQAGAIFHNIFGWPSEMAGSCGVSPCNPQQLCVATEPYQCIDIKCDSQHPIENGVIELMESDKSFLLDKASVVCNRGYVSDKTDIICKAPEKLHTSTCVREGSMGLKCTITGIWEEALCLPGCSVQPGEFTGSLSYTTGGFTCQRWDKQSPHGHGYGGDHLFPDGSASAAENYCRALGEVYLWCYTTNSSKRWDYCTKPAEVC